MSFSNCDCVAPPVLTAIAKVCEFDMGDLYKLMFQKAGQAGIALATWETAANWVSLKAAVDDTKVVVSPVMYDGDIPEAGELTFTGHNGNDQVWGYSNQTISGMVKFPDASAYTTFCALACQPSMAFAWIGSNDKITAKENAGSPKFIPVDGRVTVSPPSRAAASPLQMKVSFNVASDWFNDVSSHPLVDGSAKDI